MLPKMQDFVFPLFAIFSGILAQDINSLPECERNCVNLGVRVGPNLGCPATDNGQSAPTCLCNSTQFAYAIRDCATESCPQGTNMQQVNEYGIQYCQSAQGTASGAPLAAIGVFSSGAPSSASSSSSREPITTIPVISTITSGSTTQETTVGSSTIYSGDPNSTLTAITTQPIVSTISHGSTTRETTVGSSTVFSSATSSSSQGAGATMTPLRVMPAFVGRQGNANTGSWVTQAMDWTVVVVGLVQLMW